MPLVFTKRDGDAVVALWRVTESEEQLSALVCADDVAEVASYSSESRRREKLAWRALLYHLYPDAVVSYTEEGAPVVEGAFIGVAHSANMVGVIVSPAPCAIDIEPEERDFRRATGRFISPAEARLNTEGYPLFAAAVWCAKETLYKFHHGRELDLLEDIVIVSVDMERGLLSGSVKGGAKIDMRIFSFEGYLIVFAG